MRPILLAKIPRTDGGIDFLVEFSDGTRTYQKSFAFFGDFDLSGAVKREIDAQAALSQVADAVSIGPINLPAEEPIVAVVNQAANDIDTLRKLQTALSLGLVDQAAVDAQVSVVKQNPDFLALL